MFAIDSTCWARIDAWATAFSALCRVAATFCSASDCELDRFSNFDSFAFGISCTLERLINYLLLDLLNKSFSGQSELDSEVGTGGAILKL